MHEFGVTSATALAAIAHAGRLKAIASALLEQGGRTLDPDTLRLAATLTQSARLETVNALELEQSYRAMAPLEMAPARDFARERAELEASWEAEEADPSSPFATAADRNLVQT